MVFIAGCGLFVVVVAAATATATVLLLLVLLLNDGNPIDFECSIVIGSPLLRFVNGNNDEEKLHIEQINYNH